MCQPIHRVQVASQRFGVDFPLDAGPSKLRAVGEKQQRRRAEQLIEELCQKLLANPVIEEYRCELKDLSSSTPAGTQ